MALAATSCGIPKSDTSSPASLFSTRAAAQARASSYLVSVKMYETQELREADINARYCDSLEAWVISINFDSDIIGKYITVYVHESYMAIAKGY